MSGGIINAGMTSPVSMLIYARELARQGMDTTALQEEAISAIRSSDPHHRPAPPSDGGLNIVHVHTEIAGASR
jgi:hypothetical protein